MSHHYSGPNFAFPGADARLDFTDLFAFPSPENPDRSILIMNSHPADGANPPGPTTTEPFAPEARHEIRIDTNGDAVADLTYQVRFTSAEGGGLTATAHRLQGADSDGRVIIANAPVSMGADARITASGDYRLFAGWRSDPFFFDVQGAINNLQFTGDDFFTNRDVCTIVLEVPNSDLGSQPVGVWCRVLIPAEGGGWAQADRGARPSQTPFLSGEQNAAYLAAEPKDDAQFIAHFAHSLEHTGGYTAEAATQAAKTLLPDLLPYDPTRPASFPENGRLLTDDTSDYFLAILTNGKVTTDHVGPHTDLLADFPYLGPPHDLTR